MRLIGKKSELSLQNNLFLYNTILKAIVNIWDRALRMLQVKYNYIL